MNWIYGSYWAQGRRGSEGIRGSDGMRCHYSTKGFQDTNPGSITHFERSPNGNMTKAFVLLNSWARSFMFCLPVVSLDACHLRCKEDGTLFLASALSPNRDIVIIAAGIGLMEDGEHWEWFVERLRAGTTLQDFSDSVVMSDREKGLDTALSRVLGDVPHSYCSFHLKKNVVTNFKTDLKGKIRSLAKSLTASEYRAILEECEKLSPHATQYLKEVSDEKWTASHFPRPRFGIVTTNISESSNSWLLEDREQTWFSCLSSVVREMQERMFDLRDASAKITTTFAPWVEAKVMKFYSSARKRLVSCVSDNVYEVMQESTRTHAVVDLEAKTCSCNFWAEHQYPCVHACAAIMLRREDPIAYISDYYRTSHIQEVFAPYARPVDIAFCEPDGTLPPAIAKRKVRPKKIRIRNRSEYINGDSPYQCSRCFGNGHNKRTCERREKAREKAQKKK